jgi:hypothetical protein
MAVRQDKEYFHKEVQARGLFFPLDAVALFFH